MQTVRSANLTGISIAASPSANIIENDGGICVLTTCVPEVAQQSKARNKEDFLTAFSPVIAEATASAYKGASSDIQGKLKRVVDVWRSRQVFEGPIQDAIEARIEGELSSYRCKEYIANDNRTRQISSRC